MTLLPLPRTAHCLVCGKDNPLGHRLQLAVDDSTGDVHTEWTPSSHHRGFEQLVHGGATATVLDEAMAWTAIWALKRMAVCGEMTVRFVRGLAPGEPVRVVARVESVRRKLVCVAAEVHVGGEIAASATGKYLPAPAGQNRQLLDRFVVEPHTAVAAQRLRAAGN